MISVMDPKSEEEKTEATPQPHDAKPESFKILVVDDDPVTRQVVSKLLTGMGYEVKTASGGRQALGYLKEESFNLQLVDVMMPDMDGLTLIRVFKQATTQDIPTIMMSGSTSPDTVKQVFNVGAEDFLQKPIKEELLRRRIEKCIEMKNRKMREQMTINLINEEQQKGRDLNARLEKYTRELEEYKKQVQESLETPMQLVVSTIKDLMNGTYDAEQSKLALISILKSLGGSDLFKPAFVEQIQRTNIDPNMRDWLISQFTRGGEESLSKSTASAAPLSSISPLAKNSNPEDLVLPFDLDNYVPPVDLQSLDFDALIYSKEELKRFVMCMFRDKKFCQLFHFHPAKLYHLLNKLEQEYKHNHYHNFFHAIDVTQVVYFFICDPKVCEVLNQFEQFTMLISALCHDVGHPGLNNNFLINTRHEFAILYNDKSVLENYHASFGSKLLLEDSYNVLEGLTREQYRDFRRHYTQIILATDMANHFTICSKFETRISTGPLSKDNPDDKFQLMRMIMKCADISNITRSFPVAKKWATHCVEEFFNQGDKEKEIGLPVSPLMDRNTINFPKSQIDFSDFVAAPMFKQVVSAFPHMTYIIATIKENRARWKLMYDEQEKAKAQEAIANRSPEKKSQQEPRKEMTQHPVPEKEATLSNTTQLPPKAADEEIKPIHSQQVSTATPSPLPTARKIDGASNNAIPMSLIVFIVILAIVVYAIRQL